MVDAVTCPVCHERFNCITAGHYRNHGFQTADDFKKAFDLNTLKAPSIAAAHSARMTARNPMSGNRHRQQTRAKMSRHRKGKGVGRAGKYERTPEIRARISKGVAAFQLEHPRHALKGYQGQWVDLDVCAPDVWVRSSWEARMLLVLDKHPDVDHVEVEPFAIPYLFEGVVRQYIPDFLVHFHSGIREIWEVKPAELLGDPKVQAKIAALNDYVVRHEMNGRIVTLADLEGMERKTALMFAMRPF